jgi:DNA-binding NtrC family response regulator
VGIVVIADKDVRNREEIAGFLGGLEFTVVTADSGVEVLKDVLEKDARVILLGAEFDDLPNRELLPLLKGCRRNLVVILVSNEESLPLLRRFRRDGLFFHALKPVTAQDREELLQVVHCALALAPKDSGCAGTFPGGHQN